MTQDMQSVAMSRKPGSYRGVVCSDADVQCIFQPCHHVVCCQEQGPRRFGDRFQSSSETGSYGAPCGTLTSVPLACLSPFLV